MNWKFLDPDHPFFAPAWRRWATVLFLIAWVIFEAVFGTLAWALGLAALGLYAFWVLIVKGPTQR